jgi:hypothetical protein
LYKISNCNGGNPGASLREYQLEGMKMILQKDILESEPDNILFLTGESWASPFIKDHFKADQHRLEYLDKTGSFQHNGKTFNCIISPHPQEKKEDRIVEEILKYLR